MKRLSITLIMVALVGSIANMQAAHRNNAVQQQPQKWICTWEQAECVELDDKGEATVMTWKCKKSHTAIDAKSKEEAIAKTKKVYVPEHVQTQKWSTHSVQA